MKRLGLGSFVVLSASLLATACQSSASGGGTGGSVDAGAVGSGGKADSGTGGGSPATGGASGSGGRSGSGGASSSGGASGTGGAVASGGATGTGGTAGSGGSSSGSGGGGGRAATGSGGSAGSAGAGAQGSGGATGTGGAAGGGGGLHLYTSPNGAGTTCSVASPCSLTQAQTTLRAAPAAMHADAIVELADGIYPLAATLTFGAGDSGTTGHPVVWQAATGARPIVSGARRITGWAVSDSAKNIWKATAPADFATRQLFVDGKIATRARYQLNRADLTFTTAGFTFTSASLSFLTSVAHQDRLDLHAVGSFTDRYSPIKSIASGTATMVQPAWANNNWGYDTIPSPFRAGPLTIENAYELIDQAGEWYLDTTAGALYYKPLAGQDMSTADVELPQLEVLAAIAGTYDQPAHDLTFRGLTFSYTSWLAPNTTDGYASQQTGGFISGTGYAEFEATRPKWHQMPAAVQVSAAKGISFLRDRFVALGQAALGIGNDDNAHLGKLGLGADTISVTGCVFTQIAAGPIVIGGIQENAHHPSDPRMVNQNMMVSNNLIHDVSIDYRDGAGLLFTYTKNVVVSHNELYNLPYSGIATGYGWGANDAGGSDDYANRGLYKYQTRYTTATIAQQNQVVANYLHDGMQQMNDGGCHYNLSANPMTVVSQNYCKGPWPASSFGDYEDEGSRYLTITKNVFSGWGSWSTANANATNHTGDLMFTNNWVSGSQGIRGTNNTITGNITISGALPADAMTVVNAAGLEAAYADLKTAP